MIEIAIANCLMGAGAGLSVRFWVNTNWMMADPLQRSILVGVWYWVIILLMVYALWVYFRDVASQRVTFMISRR